MSKLTDLLFSGSFSLLVRPWAAIGGAVGVALVPLMQGWVSIPYGLAAGLLMALVVAYFVACHERDEIRRKLDEREKWREVIHKLGEFVIQGKAMVPKPYTKVAEWEEIYAWRDAVAKYLEFRMGMGFRAVFESGAGNEPKVPEKIRPGEDAERWIHIQARLITLKKIIWMLAERELLGGS